MTGPPVLPSPAAAAALPAKVSVRVVGAQRPPNLFSGQTLSSTANPVQVVQEATQGVAGLLHKFDAPGEVAAPTDNSDYAGKVLGSVAGSSCTCPVGLARQAAAAGHRPPPPAAATC